MTAPKPPSPGDYNGAAQQTGSASVSSSGSNDIWGLGDLYGQSIYTGTVTSQVPVVYSGSGDLKIGAAPSTNTVTKDQFGSTQDFMQHVVDLWAAQQAEREKYPHRLTTYEQIQRSLWQAGFFGQTSLDSIHVGQWTSQTQDALVQALGSYEQATEGGKLPLTFTEFLNQNATMSQDGGQNSATGPTKAPFQASLADPATIQAAAQSAAQQALGRALSPGELSTFVSQFQAAQTAAQKQAYNGNDSTQPDLGSQAMAFVQSENPKAYAQNQRTQYLDALVNMLGGNRPSPTAPVPSVGG